VKRPWILYVAYASMYSGELQFTTAAQLTYKVQLTANEGSRIVELSAEKYVESVLAGESSVFRSSEATRAMAVVARTFAARQRGRHGKEGFDFCATTHCQRVELRNITNQLREAAEATAGELLWFAGKPVLSVYARDCGGRTENVQAVWPETQAPYLVARADPYCVRYGLDRWSWLGGPEQIVQALRDSGLRSPDHLRTITIVNRTSSGRARTLQLSGDGVTVPISASSFRFAIGRSLGWNSLRSDRYEIEIANRRIMFRGAGEGHGVGLCQHGADEMGVEGLTYREILAFYYPGTEVARTGDRLKWTRLGGEGVAVFTTRAAQDAVVLPLAEHLKGRLEAWLRTKNPREIAIRVFPDIDAFRNGTGEPGWVAARTVGSNIDLQPASALQARGILGQTLQHELLHVLVEQEAAPGLPLWFREGLVGWLDGHSEEASSNNSPPRNRQVKRASSTDHIDDTALRQRENRRRAGRAYEQANARVEELVTRYGADAVFGWLRRGLPAEVTNSSASSAATKSR
jgi:stage II sporulation protein D